MSDEQLLLFHMPKSDLDQMNDELVQVVEKLDKYRKSMHAKLGNLSSDVRSLQARVDIQEAQMYVLRTYLTTYFEALAEKELDLDIVNFS